MQKVEQAVPTGTVQGVCDARFRPLLDAFIENFTARNEIGASLCVTLEGCVVVDLWGGLANPRDGLSWERDTVGCVFSCTKGAMAVIAHMLAERGALDLDVPVIDLWAEYGKHGKEMTTTRMMLDHTAGVPALRDPVKEGGAADWGYMTARIAAEEPFFVPGTRSAYHGLTFAWTVGEMIRRAAGMTAGQFLAREVAGPLGLDFWIGLPEEIEPRVARLVPVKVEPGRPRGRFVRALSADKASIPALFYNNDGGFNPNRRLYRAAEIGSANGVTHARGLAGLYAPLANGGTLDGVRLLAAETIAAMARVSNATHEDATLCVPERFGAGVMRACDRRHLKDPEEASLILGEEAFGHSGAGGSLGFADPEPRLSFGYTLSRMAADYELRARTTELTDACYRALGYRSNQTGVWRA